jgi:hypothetical protein
LDNCQPLLTCGTKKGHSSTEPLATLSATIWCDESR